MKMSRPSTKHTVKQGTSPKQSSSLTSALCNKRVIAVSVIVSCAVYFAIFLWTSSSKRLGQARHDLLEDDVVLEPNSRQSNVKNEIQREFDDRKRQYEEKCTNRTEGQVRELFLYPPSKLAVCHVPKAGCTFWKRLFRYLNKDHAETNISSLFDIDRVQAHFGPSSSLRTYSFQSAEGRLMVDASTKVLMVRDPYRRLWSAYLDKFVLPEWWLDHGKAMMYKREQRYMKSCPDDITFEEFLEYTLQNHDQHWRPISQLCDPCAYRPKFVAHMDTFMRDVRYILKAQGLGSLLEYPQANDRFTDDIINLVDYHYQLYPQKLPLHECVSIFQLASKLWRVLQLNGYFTLGHPYPNDKILAALKDANARQARDKVIEIFLAEFERSPATEDSWRQLREKAITEAYRNVSDVTKEKIMRRYYDDLDLFGFDKSFPG